MYLNHFPDVYYEFAYLCVQGHTSGSQKHLLEEGRVGRNLALYLCTKNKPCSTDLLRIEMSGPPASGEVYCCHGFLPVDFFIQSNDLISDTSRSEVLFPPGRKTLCRWVTVYMALRRVHVSVGRLSVWVRLVQLTKCCAFLLSRFVSLHETASSSL